MLLTRTIKLKLEVKPEEFKETFLAYSKAFDFVAKQGFELGSFNKFELHKVCYIKLRETLPAQLCVSATAKASEALKSVFVLKKKGKSVSCPEASNLSLRLDHRSYNVWFDRNECSILLATSRKKFSFSVPSYFEQFLSWRRRSAELFVRKNKVFLNIVFDKDVEDATVSDKFIGVDRGIKKLAVTSDNQFFGGGKVRRCIRRYSNLRRDLQRRGTKSAKRHLKRISLRENRFVRDTNHCVSKQIVASLERGDTLVLEKLTGIRENSRKFRKKERGIFNKWSFFQLEAFLSYKAQGVGCFVAHVDPRYTSQKCSKCGHIERGNRVSQSVFKCKQCSFSLNADLNAARNISQNHQDAIRYPDRASVNKPIVATCELQAHDFSRG